MSRASYNNPQFIPFQSGSTLCYPSKDYADFNGGGNSLISTKPGKNLFKVPNYKVDSSALSSLSGKSYATSAGGAKKKRKTTVKKVLKKGGNSEDYVPGNEMPMTMEESSMSGGKKSMKKKSSSSKKSTKSMKKGGSEMEDMMTMEESSMSGGKKSMKKKSSSSKKTTKSMKKRGGAETEGATGMPSQFFNNTSLEGYPLNSGMDVMSAYGLINPGNVGIGNLAPFNVSKNSAPLTMMKTGGKKVKKTLVKKKNVKKTVKKPLKKRGGAETEGATGLPIQFYNNGQVDNYPSNSGNGVNSAYGRIVPKDAGVGNLAPFNVSKNSAPLTMMKTGGKRKVSKSKKGGKYIGSMSDQAFVSLNNIVDSSAKSIKNFMSQLERNYNKSLTKIDKMRTGMDALQKGGVKKNTKTKSSKSKKQQKVKKGGDGSDFISTLNSRGPANYPDSGEKMFRVFSKTGQYIPNSQLAYAAAPKLTGGPKVENVVGFNSFGDEWASVSGGAKKRKTVKKSPKKSAKSAKSVKKST